jgi:deoxycytidine triphosphate deaminase
MILRAEEIKKAINEGGIQINPFDENQLKNASYTFTLGSQYEKIKKVDFVDSREESEFEYFDIGEEGLILRSGDFAVLQTNESLKLSNNFACFLSMRGKRSQQGLDALSSAIFCEPGSEGGFGGPLSLEVVYHGEYPIKLFSGIKIVKAVFFKVSSQD